MSLRKRLLARERARGPILVGLVGAGQMGTGLISQIEQMAGMRIVAVADIAPGRAEAAYSQAGVSANMVLADATTVGQAEKAIAQGRRVATRSADLLVRIPQLEVIVEATGIPEVGASVCHAAILAGKHVVNMNVEADATVGWYLAKMARAAGVVYTLTAGDEPGAIKELYDFADALGFEIVCIGKGKNNPLDRSVTPDRVAERARQQQMSAKMLASFVDGTKTMVEMTSVGNATGFAPEVRGAHGPRCTVQDLPRVFVPKSDGGVLASAGAVDYAVGDVAPGVFVIITTDQPKIIADLRYLRLNGYGKYWALYRPYHLANLETPISIARAVLYGEATLATERPPVAETIAMAKRDLKAGEKIDGLGGYTVYGMIEKAQIAREQRLTPLGLAIGATVTKDIPQGAPLPLDALELDETQYIVHLRYLQDKMLAESDAED
ncbi:MAG: flagellar biosynthesis protein FlgA [Chloroflexi bacterium]|nr:flagellar biosynthesis protein FlgA [Chloroflexota bacterium]